ncbi:MAG: hypothetical protein ACTSRU_16045, partial [Candidatus Hodarchaeales archaeon]
MFKSGIMEIIFVFFVLFSSGPLTIYIVQSGSNNFTRNVESPDKTGLIRNSSGQSDIVDTGVSYLNMLDTTSNSNNYMKYGIVNLEKGVTVEARAR